MTESKQVPAKHRPSIDKIIPNHEQLCKIIHDQRQKGKTIVMCNGCFDLLHVGHVRYLEAAKLEGDVLVVALNSDESFMTYKKKKPVNHLDERMELIAALQVVDYVTFFDEPKVDGLLLMIRPDVQAKGTDYTEQNVPERDIVISYGGRVAITGDPKDHSTSEIIKKIEQGTH